MKSGHSSKDLYKRLRVLPWARLWEEEVPRFDRASQRERFERVAVVRAVGVVFSEAGPTGQRNEVKEWLVRLLKDPEEKIRRYAMTALPKIGVGEKEEAELLALLEQTSSEREGKYLGRTLGRVGGVATAKSLAKQSDADFSTEVKQRIKASVARIESPSAVAVDRLVAGMDRLRIHLRGRRGLEGFMRAEVEQQGKFRVVDCYPGLVAVQPLGSLRLADLLELRCFDTVGFVLGLVKPTDETPMVEALAKLITSSLAQRLFDGFTQGAIRYRLEFVGKGHRRGSVRQVADRAYELCPRLLNDARQAPWAIDIHATGRGRSVELRPRLHPDPRFPYRLDDVPAASHPPLAACMVQLAKVQKGDVVWDPFCGTALELIECARTAPLGRIYGSDISAEAIDIAGRCFGAAGISGPSPDLVCCDFREFAKLQNVPNGCLSLIISNPPLGRRIRIQNLRGMFEEVFSTAARLLKTGGRLVLTNPFPMETANPLLQREYQQLVDLGGFDCRLELYRKLAAPVVAVAAAEITRGERGGTPVAATPKVQRGGDPRKSGMVEPRRRQERDEGRRGKR